MRTRAISGTVTMTDAAMIGPHGISCSELPDSNAMPTGTVRAASFEAVKVSAYKYSFHAAIKASKPVVQCWPHQWHKDFTNDDPRCCAVHNCRFFKLNWQITHKGCQNPNGEGQGEN